MNNNIRNDFPILKNNNTIFFDNSSTSLKPKIVIDSVNEFYNKYTSNAYRGDYINSEIVSLKIDECRSMVATLINCSENEIIFTMNSTDSINLLSNMLRINKRDNVICSILEHHSNLLPWINKANISIVHTDKNGIIDLDELENELKSKKVKLVSITAVSNITGNVQPIKDICKLAHKYNSLVMVDACQMVPHLEVDVKEFDCDFMVFSAHKMCGPSGVGVLYGRKELLKKCKIAKYGGGMVDKIANFENIRYKEIPYCFESGTPPIEGIFGFGSAIRYYLTLGYESITEQNKMLNDYFYDKVLNSKNIELLFPISNNHIPIFTFKFKNKDLNIHYIAKILSDSKNICVSAGYQCAQPLYNYVEEKGGIRVSLQFYNTIEEIDYFFDVIDNLNI